MQRLRTRLYELTDTMQAYIARLAIMERDVVHLGERVETDVNHLTGRLAELVTRVEFSPVQKVVYGLAASIMGAFIMAVAALVFRALPK